MRIRKQVQLNQVSDEVLALTAIVRPILLGVLYSLKQDVVAEVGGYQQVKLKMLGRLRRPGDGDCGVCFEYAVHEALNSGDARVHDRIATAIKMCKIKGKVPQSILFGVEKSGALQLIDTAKDLLTEDSRVLSGAVGQPAKLKKHLDNLASAFKNPRTRLALPYSIRGLWKADLFVGYAEEERWVGTSVKINPNQLEGAAGLRIGIVPTRQGTSDRVRLEESKNLIVCPLHHDRDFMQAFYEGWRIVQAFLTSDAKVPKEVDLPRPIDREVARILEERREFTVEEVVAAIEKFGQPDLLQTDVAEVDLERLKGEVATDVVIAPVSKISQ